MNKYENLYVFKSVKSFKYYLVNIMRIFLLLITIGLSSAFANNVNAQTKIDVNVSNVTLEELFKDIQGKSEFIFFYKDNVLKYKVSKLAFFFIFGIHRFLELSFQPVLDEQRIAIIPPFTRGRVRRSQPVAQ